MKLQYLFLLFLAFCLACEERPEVPPPEDLEEKDPFSVSGFIPGINTEGYAISDKLIYLGKVDRDQGNSIVVFDTESERVIQEMPYGLVKHKFLGKHQDELFLGGWVYDTQGVRRATLVLMDLQGQVKAEYSSDNSCLPLGYEFGEVHAVDQEGNIWLTLRDMDVVLGNPPAGPDLGLLRFDPKSNTCSYWNVDNSSIPSNQVYEALPYQDKVYFVSPLENDSLTVLCVWEAGRISVLKTAERDYPRLRDLGIDRKGELYYTQIGENQQLLMTDGARVETGLREDYSQEAATYLLDEAENSFVLGRASILREYSNYDPYRDFFSFFSKNGEVLVDENTDFQAFAA